MPGGEMAETYAVQEWSHVDKSAWARGEWHNEPDKVQWVDEATGLDCLLHRGPHGGWCGYVGVPETHPAFAKHYDKVDADVHGGLTYSDFCQTHPSGEEHPAQGICHVPYAGRPHRVWWLGFDCAHSGDLSPSYAHKYREWGITTHRNETYKNREYATSEVTRLAAQLATK
jgi:hypothetical protein